MKRPVYELMEWAERELEHTHKKAEYKTSEWSQGYDEALKTLIKKLQKYDQRLKTRRLDLL